MAVREPGEGKQAEKMPGASEAKFQSLVDLLPDAIVISNEEGRVLLVNSETQRLFGFSREELIQQLVEMLIPKRLRIKHADDRKKFLANPQARPMGTGFELIGLRKDGTEFPVEISLGTLRAQEGLLICSVIRDITDRKHADAILKRTAAELARSNAELEQFAGAASHDLQEPLRTVAGITQLFARDYKHKLDAEAAELLDMIARAAKRMQLLLNALLDYARLGAQEKPFELVDCQIVYQAAVANLKLAIEESGAELTAGHLPSVLGDVVQITQLFQNLLANAIKFKARERRPQILVSAQQLDKEWRIAVHDNGIGIDPKNFERLFMPFQRLHTPDQYRGTGIGLAMCKKIVERHGGRIWVESALGNGATFYLTIPTVEISLESGRGGPHQ